MKMSENLPPLNVVSDEDAGFGEVSLMRAMDSFSDPMFIKDRQHRWIGANVAFLGLLGTTRDKVLYKSDPDFFSAEQAKIFWHGDDLVFASGQPSESEEKLTGSDGVERTIWTRKYPICNEASQVIGLSGVITDITLIRHRLETALRLEAAYAEQQRVIASQQTLLSKLAVPVIQIWDGILLLPMVGEITAQRAAQVMEDLLQAITQNRTRFALIDITGVPVVDATVASYLVRTVQAVRLLGCQSITVGIGAKVAAQLVKLGVDVSALTTHATLQQGLLYAMQQLSARSEGPRGLPKPR